MIVCPVCEHAQAQGSECEVCGRALAPPAAAAAAPAAVTVEGLEPTRLTAWDAGAIARIPDLEPTGHEGGAQVSGLLRSDPVPDLEATSAAPVDVETTVAPDLERTEHAGLPPDEALALPALPVCRYCRTPAGVDERVCSRCGMRLPVVLAAAPAPGVHERFCSCGSPVVPGRSMCPTCGARVH